jgi:hypothetical protein
MRKAPGMVSAHAVTTSPATPQRTAAISLGPSRALDTWVVVPVG